MKTVIKKPREKMYGNRIKQILTEKGMSPQELSDIIETTPSHISRIINGQRRCISLPIAYKIANALDMPIESVFMLKKPVKVKKTEGDAD